MSSSSSSSSVLSNVGCGISLLYLVSFIVSVILLSLGSIAECKDLVYSCPQQVYCSAATSSSQSFYGPCDNKIKDNSDDQTCALYCSLSTTPKCARATNLCNGQYNPVVDCVDANTYCGGSTTLVVVGSLILTLGTCFYLLYICSSLRARARKDERVAATSEGNENNRNTSPQYHLPQSSSLAATIVNYHGNLAPPPTTYPRFDNIPRSRQDDLLSPPIGSNESLSSRVDRVRGSLSMNNAAYRDYWAEMNEESSLNETGRNNATNPSPSNRNTRVTAQSTSSTTTRSIRDIPVANPGNNIHGSSNRLTGSSSRNNPTTTTTTTSTAHIPLQSTESPSSRTNPRNRPITITERNVPQRSAAASVPVNNVRSPYHQPTTTIVVVAEAVMSVDDHSHENIPIVEAIPLL